MFRTNVSYLTDANIEPDVTLVSDDQIEFQAHKTILAAGSKVIRNLLYNNHHQRPLIYLRNILSQELESILAFLYTGQVTVMQNCMGMLLENAENLQIENLADSLRTIISISKPAKEQNKEIEKEINVEDKNVNDSTNDKDDKEEKKEINIEDKNINDNTNDKEDKEEQNKISSRSISSTIDEILALDILADISDIQRFETRWHECNLCDKKFLSTEDVEKHFKRNHRHGSYKCNKCIFEAKNRITLYNHKKSIHDGVRYSCTECDYQATDKSNLSRHQNTIHKGVRYKCTVCAYLATDQGNLKRHQRVMHEHKCKECGLSFGDRNLLNSHIDSNHKRVKDKRITNTCDKCSRSYRGKGELERHVKISHEGLRYPCNICNHQATDKGSLKRHIQAKHEGIKYSCTECYYKTGYKDYLKIHLAKHKGITNAIKYFCDQCNYQAKQEISFKNHYQSVHQR